MLSIHKLSHACASAAGGTEIILLCEGIDRDDIEVRFFELRKGKVYWEANGEFKPSHVFKQVGFLFFNVDLHST